MDYILSCCCCAALPCYAVDLVHLKSREETLYIKDREICVIEPKSLTFFLLTIDHCLSFLSITRDPNDKYRAINRNLSSWLKFESRQLFNVDNLFSARGLGQPKASFKL
jgi:hypothetical protein